MRQLLNHEFDDVPVAEYEVDPKDCYIASKYMSKKLYGFNAKRSSRKNSAPYLFSVYAVVAFFFSFLFSYLPNTGVLVVCNTTYFSAGVATALTLAVLVYLVVLFWIIPARVSKRMGEAMQGERQLVWRGNNGLAVETTSKTVFFDYKGIDEVSPVAQGMVVRVGVSGFYIPNSGFRSDIQRKEFVTFLKSKLKVKALAVSSIFTQIEA